MSNKINLLYFANWERGKAVLETLSKIKKINILCVFTQFHIDSKDIYYNSVYRQAKDLNIEIFNTHEIDSTTINKIILEKVNHYRNHYNNIMGFSVAFNKIFTKSLINAIKIINIHPSFLPYYRGPSPELWAVLNNDEQYGITLHYVDEGIDTGNIICQKKFFLDYKKTWNEYILDINRNCQIITNQFFNTINSEYLIMDTTQETIMPYCNRIKIPPSFWSKNLEEIREFLQNSHNEKK